jgi:hypothetical protein
VPQVAALVHHQLVEQSYPRVVRDVPSADVRVSSIRVVGAVIRPRSRKAIRRGFRAGSTPGREGACAEARALMRHGANEAADSYGLGYPLAVPGRGDGKVRY